LKNNNRGWGDRKLELLVALAYEIGKSLGYDHIDKATLRDRIYVPQGYEDNEEQFRQIRTALLQVLRGERRNSCDDGRSGPSRAIASRHRDSSRYSDSAEITGERTNRNVIRVWQTTAHANQ
jgi:hypothetical protein